MPFSKKAKRELLDVYTLNAITTLDFLTDISQKLQKGAFFHLS